MKKVLAGMLALMLLLGGVALAEEDGYLNNAMTLAGKVGELARDDVYQDSMSGMSFDCIEALKEADFTELKSAWRCEFPSENVLRTFIATDESADISEAGMERLLTSLPLAVLTMYNGRQSQEAIASASILTYTRTYRMTEGFEPSIYLLELEGAMVGVAFSATGEDTITASAMPVFIGEGQNVEQVKGELSMEGLLTFEEIA